MLALRIKKAVRNGATLVVADPRAIWLTKLAKRHLQLRPGSDVWLLNAIMHVILEEGLQDDDYIAAHCEDFEAVREVVARYTPEEAERVTGVSAEAIRATAREYATERHAAIFYTLGITEHACGVDNIWSLANLVLMTGHLGYESTGLNALRGQNNVQGLNDSGANPHYFPGYQPWDDPDVREKFATAWGVDLPERAGYRLDQMMSGLHDDRIKALYLVGENPAQTEPNAHHVEEGLQRLEFLVSQDIFLNETSRKHANVVLPASSFAEKDGTFTNTERRINRVRAAVPLPGNARGDREIVIALARALGCDWPEYPDAESVWDELADLCPNWYGIRYPRLEEHGMQWPCPSEDHPGTMFLHEGHPVAALREGQVPPGRVPAADRGAGLRVPVRPLHRADALPLQLGGDDDAGGGDHRQAGGSVLRDRGRGHVGPRRRGGRVGAARLAARRPHRPRAAVGPRLPRSRLDGAALRGSPRQLAHARRRRPADRDARVQGLGRPAGAGLTPLSPAFAEPLLRGRFGRPYLYAERTETTQRMLDADQPEGAVAVAEEQTEGRGRMGRRWEAPAGSSLLVSTLLRPPPERRAAELTLLAGVAVAVVVERATGLAAQIKWPNDVMLNRRKVAGVLAELKDDAVVLGIGINVNQRPNQLPTETKAAAGSLYSVTGRESERGELLADLLLELERRYDAWRDEGLAALYEDLGARDFLRGRRVTLDGVAGTAQMITRDGRLAVATSSGLVVIESGEVLFER